MDFAQLYPTQADVVCPAATVRFETDRRCHGTVQEIGPERFALEAPTLRPLPAAHDDAAYRDFQQVSWDAYIGFRGCRYSVPADLADQTVQFG